MRLFTWRETGAVSGRVQVAVCRWVLSVDVTGAAAAEGVAATEAGDEVGVLHDSMVSGSGCLVLNDDKQTVKSRIYHGPVPGRSRPCI